MHKTILDFENTIYLYEKKLKAIKEKESSEKISNDKWSKKEILGHLIDSSINNTIRFVTGQAKNNLVFDGYDQDFWVKAQGYQNRKWKDLINHWKLANLHIINIIKLISPEKLKHDYTKHNFDKISWKGIEKSTPVNLEYLIIDYIGHTKHHLKQIC